MDRLPEKLGFDWIDDMCLSEGACVTFTEHDDVRHVAAAFGGRMDHAVLIEGVRPLDEALGVVEERFPGTWVGKGLPVALFARLSGWVITFEDNGGEGIRKEILERASGTSRAASVFWNVNRVTRGAFAEHGRILAEVSDGIPVVHGAGDGRIDAALEGLDGEDPLGFLFTLSARLTGQVFTPESLNGEFLAVPLVPWPQPDADGRLLRPEFDGALGDALRSAGEGSLRRAALAAARYAVSVAGISSHPVIIDTLAAWPERPALLERMARSVGSRRADDPNRIPQQARPARAEPTPADDPAGGSLRIALEAMRSLHRRQMGYPEGVSSSEPGHAMAVQALVQATETSAPAIAAYRAITYADEARRELRHDVTELREAVMRAFAAS
ncbi:hypothetical protein GCM10010404_91410 [Nonomuraea africana]|uniref:DUF4192 domain-containing protein n=1 Tax=Nonomuraea africana TaxID=46171 RepID=A0ABR9KCZ6_9ACTN|nr:hypothetical protein [Nonomuraea africana]MBE1559810.1 hypothetical protein [Nonomuraea africana]